MQGGLKEGDIVSKIGGVKISTAEDVIDASFFLTAGDRVPIIVEREGQEISVDVRPVEHPVTNSAYYPQSGLSELHALVPRVLSSNEESAARFARSPKRVKSVFASFR